MKKISVRAANGKYDVLCGRGVLRELPRVVSRIRQDNIIGQLGEPIVGQAFNALTSNLLPALIVVTNILSAIIMMVFGIIEWRSSKI